MKLSWTVFESLIVMVETLSLFLFTEIFLQIKYSDKVYITSTFITAATAVFVSTYHYSFEFFSPILFIFVQAAAVFVLYKGSVYAKVMLVIVITSINLLIEFLVIGLLILLFNIEMSALMAKTIYRIVAIIGSKSLLVSIVYFFRKKVRYKVKNSQGYMRIGQSYFEAIGMLVSIFTLMLLLAMIVRRSDENSMLGNHLTTINFLIIGIIAACIVILYIRLLIKSREELNMTLKLYQLQLHKQLYTDVSDIVNEMTRLRHDMKHHVIAIKTYLDREELQEAKDYMDRVWGRIVSQSTTVIVDSYPILSALLSAKKDQAYKSGIGFDINIKKEEEIQIRIEDLFSILANMIDNALEANRKKDFNDRYIHLLLLIKNEHILIRCENTYFHTILKTRHGLVTTKSNKKIHGIGLKNMKDVVDRYDGSIVYQYDDHIFQVEVFMRNAEVSQ